MRGRVGTVADGFYSIPVTKKLQRIATLHRVHQIWSQCGLWCGPWLDAAAAAVNTGERRSLGRVDC
jgi:hypothetical protein